MRNSTIIQKKKTCISCGRSEYIFSRGRCANCSRIEDTQSRMEKFSDKMIAEDGLQDLIADADEVFSKYIRLKHADYNGNVACYTCGAVMFWTQIQNGHYRKRGNLFLRYDERNVRPQCVECNQYKQGNMAEYSRRLEIEFPGITDILIEESSIVHKPSKEEIKNIIIEYTPKVKKMLKKVPIK